MTFVGSLFLTGGVLLMLVAAIGLIRLKDPLQRMHSATKAGTLGTTLVVIGVMTVDSNVELSTGVLTILFLLVTLPVAAQLLGRASYVSGVRIKGIDDDQPIEGLSRREKGQPADTRGNEIRN